MKNFLQLTLLLFITLCIFGFTTTFYTSGKSIDPNLLLQKGNRIAIIGNTLADRMQEDGWLETFIQYRFPEMELSFRNLGYSADEVKLRQREDQFGTPDEWLNHVGAEPFTINGIHFNAKGNKMIGQAIDQKLFGEIGALSAENVKLLNETVKDKGFHWFNRYRTTDGYNVYGGRSLLKWGDQTNRDVMRGIMKVVTPAEATDNSKYRLIYKGDKGPGLGKKIVFIASDHEYRSEETLPALARILAKRYGFTCTVVWALDKSGNILPGSSDLKGLEVLDDADLMVIFTRFSNFNDDEMQHIDDYLKRGGPVMGLRTATHAFSNSTNPKWKHYSYNYNGPMEAWKDGFGERILGETWVGHYGTNHKQASKFIIEESQKEHPLMRGVKNIWTQSGGYVAYPSGTVLARGQVLNGMTPDAKADTTKELLPVAWVRSYDLGSGKKGRVFTTTNGASEDLLNEGFRRMLINASLWTIGLDNEIKADNNIDFVGPYKPSTFNFEGYKANVKPSDLAGWDSLIMPGEMVKQKK